MAVLVIVVELYLLHLGDLTDTLDTIVKPNRTAPFYNLLVSVPLPVGTMFEMTGTYNKWRWPYST